MLIKNDGDEIDIDDESTPTTPTSTKKEWIAVNNEYLLPRSYIENCVVFIQRIGSTLILKTIDMHTDITLNLRTEEGAIDTLSHLEQLFNKQEITCNVDFGDENEV